MVRREFMELHHIMVCLCENVLMLFEDIEYVVHPLIVPKDLIRKIRKTQLKSVVLTFAEFWSCLATQSIYYRNSSKITRSYLDLE